jgi:hypothetical protein
MQLTQAAVHAHDARDAHEGVDDACGAAVAAAAAASGDRAHRQQCADLARPGQFVEAGAGRAEARLTA